jgi:hypothetical protein
MIIFYPPSSNFLCSDFIGAIFTDHLNHTTKNKIKIIDIGNTQNTHISKIFSGSKL